MLNNYQCNKKRQKNINDFIDGKVENIKNKKKSDNILKDRYHKKNREVWIMRLNLIQLFNVRKKLTRKGNTKII